MNNECSFAKKIKFENVIFLYKKNHSGTKITDINQFLTASFDMYHLICRVR